ncbi:3451_t:CDS:2, partial [Cetraspora pellucida]
MMRNKIEQKDYKKLISYSRQKFSHVSSLQYQENFNTNLYILKRDISKDLENVGIDSSKESNNLKDINLDFLEESDYNQENNNNFSEKFINELKSDNSNESEESDNLLNNENFENIVDKALDFDFERLSQNTNKFSPYFENLTAA